MAAQTNRISGTAMEQLLRELLSDGEVHTLDELYREVEARGNLGPGDLLKVPSGSGFNKLKELGFDPAQMSPEEKDAVVEKHSLTYELQYQNAVRFALRDFKHRGELESLGRAKYRLLAHNLIAFTAKDCELFARNLTSGSFEPLSDEEKTRYRDVRERLKKLANWAAGASKSSVPLQGFVSTLSPSGKVPRDMWSCVFPADAPHKSYALQLAIIIGSLGAELCFCLGSGESFGKPKDAAEEQRRRELEEEFRRVQQKLRVTPPFVVEMVAKGLSGAMRFRKRWRSAPGGSDFSSLQEWLAFASAPEGAGAAVSCYLSPAELEQLGTDVGARFLDLLRSFERVRPAERTEVAVKPPTSVRSAGRTLLPRDLLAAPSPRSEMTRTTFPESPDSEARCTSAPRAGASDASSRRESSRPHFEHRLATPSTQIDANMLHG